MGLRQSKRSVDITASPKKDAAVVEKAVVDDAAVVEKIEEELKTPVNGETKPTETTELVNILLSVFFSLSINIW